MKTARSELARLILDGLLGRSIGGLFKKRQELLADAVGGPCGEAIRNLRGLAFRGFRSRLMKEKEEMSSGHGLRDARVFPWVSRPDGGGRLVKQAEITCAQCGYQYHHIHRGKLESEEYFRNKGWEVGNNAEHDFCPVCVGNRKVVKMSDHRKPPPEAANGQDKVMDREAARLLSRAIEEHWDSREGANRYQPGWSDVKMAEAEGVPVAWVKAIRERDFGGVGEDPGLMEFLEEQGQIGAEMSQLATHMAELETNVAAWEAHQDEKRQKLTRILAAYRQKHNTLNGKVARLAELAEKLRPFDKAG